MIDYMVELVLRTKSYSDERPVAKLNCATF
uniref:Uncharacterized protein n=1 Tax=Physcomitrium patens TaxID=3218 RepID=A0A2K1KN63_PHYPA|nr:hypothetical protein PHYPA_006111 [Physcomitrium patens]